MQKGVNSGLELKLETSMGLRRIETADFSGFEKERRFMKKVLESVMGKCDALERENKEIKNKFQEYEHTLEDNTELKK